MLFLAALVASEGFHGMILGAAVREGKAQAEEGFFIAQSGLFAMCQALACPQRAYGAGNVFAAGYGKEAPEGRMAPSGFPSSRLSVSTFRQRPGLSGCWCPGHRTYRSEHGAGIASFCCQKVVAEGSVLVDFAHNAFVVDFCPEGEAVSALPSMEQCSSILLAWIRFVAVNAAEVEFAPAPDLLLRCRSPR